MTTEPQAPAMVGWPAIIPVHAITVALLFSVFVSIFFGLYPTNKTLKLNPLEVLHYE